MPAGSSAVAGWYRTIRKPADGTTERLNRATKGRGKPSI